MKKISFFLMAMLVSLTSFAAALGEGYEKVTDISKLAAGDRVVVYCDGSSIGVTGWNGSKDATVAAEGWVEYLVEAASNGVYLKDEKANNYIASPGSSNQFKYGTKGVCSVDANGVLKCNSRFLCHNGQNGNYYRMYTAIGSYKPFYVYKVVPVEVDPDATIYTVTVKSADETMGTVAGGGEYAEGKTATLEATPKTGYEFVKWSNESTDNPLQITVTGDIELTATFQAQAPITIAEANKLADNATCTLNEFTVTYVFKSYTHIQDASGYGMIYSSNFGLKAGDVVSGFTCTKASYNGLPQFIPTCKLADLTIVNGEAPAVAEVTTAPTGNYHQVVKLVNVKMAAGEFTTSANKTLTATCPDGTTIAVYNNKNVTATFTADKTYNITGDVCQYSGKIQVSAYAVEEYVAPAPCTFATPVKWTETISLEANADKWYLVDVAEAVAAEKDLTLSITNSSDADVEVTIDSYSTCPADELDRILASTKTIKAGQTLEKDVNFVKYLQGLVDQVYLHVTTKGGAIEVKAETAKFNVTATAENGTVEGAGIYEQGAEATLTATPAEGYEFVNWTVDGAEVSTENPYKFTVTADVALVANFKEVVTEEPLPEGVPTNAELWEAFKPYYKTFYSEERADQPITMVATFMTKGEKILTDATSEYKWLGDYLVMIATEQGYTINSEALWRWHADAFFQANQHTSWPKSADFTEAGKPENWGPYYLAAQQKPEEPVMETVYFVNALNWTGTINAYAWEPVQNANWPGAPATKEAEQIGGYDVYSYTAEAGTYANVIFNNGSSQTADLKWTAGKYYVLDGWYTKEEAEAKLATPIEDEVVYFVNNKGWNNIKAYAWAPQNADWPGVAATKEAEQIAGYDVYSYAAAPGTYANVIFNGDGGQTKDLVWTAGKYCVNDTWMTKEEAETALTGPVTPPVITYVLMGVAGDWTTGIAMTQNADNANEYVLLQQEILEGDAVKVVTLTDGTATAWCGNVDEWSVEHSADDMGNIVLAPGKYDFYYKVTEDLIYIGGEAYKPEIEWIPMDLEIANLTTEVMEVEGAKYLLLQGRDDMNDADVMLFLNNYADVDDDYEVNTESSYMTFGGMELTVLEGVMTQTSETDKGTIYTGIVRASVEEEGETMYVEFALTMYAAPATVIELTDAIVAINEELGTLTFNVVTGEGEGYYAELAGYTAPGVHEGPQICLFETPEAVAFANYVETSVADGVITLKGEFTSFMGAKFDVTISGKLPVVEPEVVEPTYTENNLNTYAFGLESVLNDDALVVTYRLNNSNADEVQVVVLNGSEVVATVPGTATIGKNTVEVPTATLPQGVQLTWKVVVKGTSVEAPTQEAKIYSFYHPSGLDIDNNPENPTFGMLLINEGMHSVKSMTDGYVSAQFGAGIFAFTPSLDLIPNGELPGYNGGIEFTTTRADGTGTAYSPRRIRISEDGRIFVTSLNTDGNYLWEVNPANMNEWTPVFKGTLNDQRELITEDSAFIAAPNNGFDVKGSGENLQLAMYSVNLSGITAAAMGGFRLHEYNLGTATEWATAPSKAIVEGKYAINYTGTQVEYDNEGGLWICSYRGTASDANPGLVHINADGVEDAKLVWNNVRQAGIRFNNDFTKLVVAGNNGAAKKATIYAISKDANGAPVLTEEAVIDMAVVGNNLNDFAWDYAGNLYACGNSAEKLVGWAMPYSGEVETPAASKYAFQLEGKTEVEYEVYEDEITNLVIDYDNMLLIGGPSANLEVDVYLGLGDYDRNTDKFALLPESSVAIRGIDATFVEGWASVDGIAQTANAVVRCVWNEMNIELHLAMSAATIEPTVVVVENAAIEVEKVLLFGDMYDYALKMTGTWTDAEGLNYPVLVEVPVYYPEATEPYEIYSTVTVGGWDDDENWLGFGEGYLTITQEGDKITAAGIVENAWAGIAIDITISGNLTTTGIEDATVVIKPVKMIQNGQLIIEKEGVQYNVQGAVVK